MRQVILLTLFLFSIKTSVRAQEKWTDYAITQAGIKVSSRFPNYVDKQGDTKLVIEYKVSSTAPASLAQCRELITRTELHKNFLEHAQESRLVRGLSDTKSVVYYFFKPPWPMPNFDCVSVLAQLTTSSDTILRYEAQAMPNLEAAEKVERMQLNDVNYTFTQTSSGVVEVLIHARFSPVVAPPRWLISKWLPQGPIGIMERFLNELQRMK